VIAEDQVEHTGGHGKRESEQEEGGYTAFVGGGVYESGDEGQDLAHGFEFAVYGNGEIESHVIPPQMRVRDRRETCLFPSSEERHFRLSFLVFVKDWMILNLPE